MNRHGDDYQDGDARLAWIGIGLIAVISITPLVLEHRPLGFTRPYSQAWQQLAARLGVVLAMTACWIVRARADRRRDARAGTIVTGLVLAGALLAWVHWETVDSAVRRIRDRNPEAGFHDIPISWWQQELYLDVLERSRGTPTTGAVPHVFRPLPYGFVRSLELVTHDWRFSCFMYRWFFTSWFLWASFWFARMYGPERVAWATVLIIMILYPLSIRYYGGQLTDPLSHALFVLSMIYIIENRLLLLTAALFLGVLCKETVVIVIPAYWAYHWRAGVRALAASTVLGIAAVAAFLAARLPVGWNLSFGSINGTEGLMIASNLGLSTAKLRLREPMQRQNYLHVALFFGVFLPWIFWRWRRIDPGLRRLFLVLAPLLYASNLCFGWLYESRNYLPLVPLLTVMSLAPGRSPAARALEQPADS